MNIKKAESKFVKAFDQVATKMQAAADAYLELINARRQVSGRTCDINNLANYKKAYKEILSQLNKFVDE